ncbi:MAG: hypothetical protein JWR37_6128 [Mycobacterium sp.]|nr:hypothetical protein [Mycobacterium sp.]
MIDWKTVRAAIAGWGPTVRLMILMATATACWIIVSCQSWPAR